jgi:methylthioribose-1-phosphate isomerase
MGLFLHEHGLAHSADRIRVLAPVGLLDGEPVMTSTMRCPCACRLSYNSPMTEATPIPLTYDHIRAVDWQEGRLMLLDQRRLPSQVAFLFLTDAAEVAQAITDMVVRGAPAIGISAAYGVVLAACQRYQADAQTWREAIEPDLARLLGARPTAVNLHWALARMRAAIETLPAGDPVPALLIEARRIHAEDVAANQCMGALGAALIEPGSAVLTHCNTGALATGGFGTALGVIRAGYAQGLIRAVYADETRPWLQGARLTAWELAQEGIPVQLIADSAAAHLMKTGAVRWVIVGADRVVANGDTANKIGTYGLAIVARHHGVKFMVVAPTSTIDLATPSGEAIAIENRAEEEVLSFNGQRGAPAEARAWNPAFDVTPAALIDAIVTEKGVVTAPNEEKLRALMAG